MAKNTAVSSTNVIAEKQNPIPLSHAGTGRKQTKKARLIELLSTGKPMPLDNLSSALGWQHHTTSAAMTRLKQEGYALTSEKSKGKTRVYALSDGLSTMPKVTDHPETEGPRQADATGNPKEGSTQAQGPKA